MYQIKLPVLFKSDYEKQSRASLGPVLVCVCYGLVLWLSNEFYYN